MSTPIRCVIGLANPGASYEATRHNAGEWFIKRLIDDTTAPALSLDTKLKSRYTKASMPKPFWLAVPTTYMNESGLAVKTFSHYYKIKPEEILVVHDELDMPVGTVRLKEDGGHGGHNGLRDIFSHLNTKNFMRLRIGIGKPAHQSQTTNYVLKAPSNADRIEIDHGIERALQTIPLLLNGERQKAIQLLHTP